MSNLDLISVIIPVYNVEKYLDRCIESTVNQTYKNLEIILVDDGSPDNCPAMCDAWAERDERIKVIHKENGGLASARNKALQEVSGDYVVYIDSDDWAEPDMVEFLYKTAVENGADVARCGFCNDYEDETDSEVIGKNVLQKPSMADAVRDLMNEKLIGGVVWNKIYKYSLVKDIVFYTEDGCSEDFMYNFRVLQNIEKIVYCDAPKYHYITRENSITSSEYSEAVFDIIRAKNIVLDYYKNDALVLPYCVQGYIMSAFIVLNGLVLHQKFLDRYDDLKKSILRYKKDIFLSGKYGMSYKLKTLLLWLSPKLYNKLLLKKCKKN